MTWISGWIRGSPPAIETIGAPASSIAAIACSTGILRRSSCSGCWILPQPEQARLHWKRGSSSTISGNFSRLAIRWRARYHPMRVLCLIRAAIGPTLVLWSPTMKGGGHAAQRHRRAQRSAEGPQAHQLVLRTVQDDAHDAERTLPRSGREPHRLHVHGDRSAGVQLGATVTQREARGTHPVPGADLHPEARQA